MSSAHILRLWQAFGVNPPSNSINIFEYKRDIIFTFCFEQRDAEEASKASLKTCYMDINLSRKKSKPQNSPWASLKFTQSYINIMKYRSDEPKTQNMYTAVRERGQINPRDFGAKGIFKKIGSKNILHVDWMT